MPKINPVPTEAEILRVRKTNLARPKVNSFVADVVIARLLPGRQAPINSMQCEFSFSYGGTTYQALLSPTTTGNFAQLQLSQVIIRFCEEQDDRRIWMVANWNKTDRLNEIDVFAISGADMRKFIPHYKRYLREAWRGDHAQGGGDPPVGIRPVGANWLLGRVGIDQTISVANHHARWQLSASEMRHLYRGITEAPPELRGQQ
jgi:hypothetical protein